MDLLPLWLSSLLYLVAAALFILDLKAMNRPGTARRGNYMGVAAGIIAVATALLSTRFDSWVNLVVVILALAAGSVVAVPAARRVKMTEMPQLVALLNGVGGGAAALVGFVELVEWSRFELLDPSPVLLTATAFAIVVGSLALSGSIITWAKLQGVMSSTPVILPAAPVLMVGGVVVAVGVAVAVVVTGGVWLGLVLLFLGLLLGVLIVLPVGGADVPIVISLLNAFTGLSVAATGWAMGNVLLLVAGTLVGAAGTMLTLAMAAGMGRSVMGVMFGALKGGSTAGSTTQSDRPVRRAQADDVAIMLAYASKVVVVPGYGLAVAQAQHVISELVTGLRERGIDASYGIHPVAGRMPGHMNVLLAEANVPYELLIESDDVNRQMHATDVVMVVGANDVVNPAARTDPAAPIYGMPIIDADQAHQTVFLKRSMRPGFAGIENELLFAERTQVLFGDAKTSLTAVVAALKDV